MEYLQFFDKEYTKINSLISDVNYYLSHTKDSYSNVVDSQKKLFTTIASSPLNISSIETLIDHIKLVIENSEDLLNSLKNLSQCFYSMQSERND